MARIAALDVGEARVGLAVADEGSPWVFGRGYLVRRSWEADMAALARFVQQEQISRFVVGLPLRTDGRPSQQAERVMRWVEVMQQQGYQVETIDERYTTQLGQQRLREAPKRLRQEKGKLDEAAAVAILEHYLQSHP